MQSFEMPKVTFQEYDKAIMLSPLTLKILTSDKNTAERFLSISQNNLREHNLCHQISKKAAFCRNMQIVRLQLFYFEKIKALDFWLLE